jgi:hypothetical protein
MTTRRPCSYPAVMLAVFLTLVLLPAAALADAPPVTPVTPAKPATPDAQAKPATPAASPQLSPLSGLFFLLGTWNGIGEGKPGEASGQARFRRDLQGQVIVRTSYAAHPKQGDRPASRHDDLMVIYPDAGGHVRADYYDNEGHVIRYAVTARPGGAVFVSDVEPNAPRFRLTYTLHPDGTLGGGFEFAPPGKPEAFSPYLSWNSRRQGSDPFAGERPSAE